MFLLIDLLKLKNIGKVNKLYNELIDIIKYFSISFLTLIIDFLVTLNMFYILKLNYILSNIFGNFTGFLIHFFLSIKFVFKLKINFYSFLIYFLTFVLGLILANLTIWFSYEKMNFTFEISKFLSIIVPFLFTYYLRKFTYRIYFIRNQRG
ncbi:GtrA family protein [Caloranaerobacter sp. DY30410]|uniref:GtrA family protein n=1 Tax=Caloranaerobacter sp. DY30410 TaxID=3238305 RepID=UPI003CFDAC34